MENLFGCCACLFQIFIIIAIINGIGKSAKGGSSSSANNANVNLDDIFNEVMKTSGHSSRSSMPTPPPAPPAPPRNSYNRPAPLPKPSRVSLTAPTVHNDHNCEEVNYDNIGSLEGGTGSFSLGEPEVQPISYREKTNVSFGREDLLKSFIMSEVLQRYDINRIYSRIPSARSDE